MGAVNYIDWTANNGVVNASVQSRTAYCIDRPIVLDDKQYYYFEVDCANTWEFYLDFFLESSLVDATDFDIYMSSIAPMYEIGMNQRATNKFYLSLITTTSTHLADGTTGGYNKIGVAINKYKIIVTNNQGTMIYGDIDQTLGFDGDIRIIVAHYINTSNSGGKIYTSSPNFTMKQDLVNAGYTNIIPLYDYLTGSSSNTNKDNILKIY